MTIPSSHTAVPATLWPPPRTAISRLRSRAKRTAAATSAAPVHRAINRGRRSAVPFHKARASSYSAWSTVISSPRNLGISMPVTVTLGGPILSVVGAVIIPPWVDGSIATSMDTAEKSAIWTSK